MRVVLLGTGTLVPEAGRRSAGLLVRCAEEIVPIDLGRGILDRMVAAGVDPVGLGRFFLTHLHPDHSVELVSLLFALRHGRDGKVPVELFGPEGLRALVDRITEAWPSTRPDYPLRVIETGGGMLVDGAARVWAGPVHHGNHPALGYRVEDAATGRSMAFTGDSGPGPDLDRLVVGVDVLVAECADGMQARAGRHLHVEALVALAERAGAETVAVTHIDPRDDRGEIMSALRAALGARVVEGEDLLELSV